MKTKLIPILLITVLILSLTATASMLIPASDKGKEKSPVISENGAFERIDFIHYAKPDKPGKPSRPPKEANCYKLLGIKWKTLPVDYTINPINSGLEEGFVTSAILTAAETWDIVTSSNLFNTFTTDYTAEYGVQNFENAIVFGDYPDSNVIGVTSIWFTRRGKQIVEFDMLFNTDFTWGDATIDPTLMDLENIATHELGHGIGLDDIYTSTCSAVTMYGYSGYGDVAKRTLEPADITGLQDMYGA